jgi:hypothetical protein
MQPPPPRGVGCKRYGVPWFLEEMICMKRRRMTTTSVTDGVMTWALKKRAQPWGGVGDNSGPASAAAA